DRTAGTTDGEVDQRRAVDGNGNRFTNLGCQLDGVGLRARRQRNVDEVVGRNLLYHDVAAFERLGGFRIDLHGDVGGAGLQHLRLRHGVLDLAEHDLRDRRRLAPVVFVALQAQLGVRL